MSVKITLDHRHYGIHEFVSEAEIPGEFPDYAVPAGNRIVMRQDDYLIDEDALLAALPDGFLPVSPSAVLLAVSDEDGGTGQSGLSRFRNWAKYFDAYTLNIFKPAPGGTDGVRDHRR